MALEDDQEYVSRFKVGNGIRAQTMELQGEYLNHARTIALWDTRGYTFLSEDVNQSILHVLQGKGEEVDVLQQHQSIFTPGKTRVHLGVVCLQAEATDEELNQAASLISAANDHSK